MNEQSTEIVSDYGRGYHQAVEDCKKLITLAEEQNWTTLELLDRLDRAWTTHFD